MKRKFFVSSTFKDFQFERDLLMREVIPNFRNEARKHGDEVDSIDLRWGLDNFGLGEEDVVTKVLSVCLEEIDNSPFMIIFLGDRWGWVPDKKFVTDEFAGKFETVEGKSVTALEIEYGLKQNSRAIICIRKEIRGDVPADYVEENFNVSQKLSALKENLKKNHGDRIIEYSADFNSTTGKLENFRTETGTLAEKILDKMREDCAEDWRRFEDLPWQSRELEAADNFAKSRAGLFVERKNLVADLKSKLENSRGVFLRGVPGSGKTSLVCKIAADFRADGKRVCNIFCGTSPLTSNAQSILQLMIYFLAPEYNLAGLDFQNLKSALVNLCQQISEPVYFIFDAVEMLDVDENSANLNFLPTQSENVHCLVTCTDDFKLPLTLVDIQAVAAEEIQNKSDSEIKEMLKNLPQNYRDRILLEIEDEQERTAEVEKYLSDENSLYKSVRDIRERMAKIPRNYSKIQIDQMPPLSQSEILPTLSTMLKKNGRELYQPTAAAMLAKKNSSSPLYLEMTAQMLNMIASPELTRLQAPEEIISLTVKFIEEMSDEPESAAVHIIREAMTRLEIFEPKKVLKALNLLAVSRHGLRLSDLQAILGNSLNPLDWARVQKYLHNFFVERQNGQLDFSHKIIRAGLRKKIDAQKFIRYEMRLAKYLEKLPAEDSIRDAEGIFYAQKYENFKFAAELYAEAHETKNLVLLHSIHEAIRDDDGDFCAEFLKNDAEGLDEKTIVGSINFFINEFYVIISSGTKKDFEIGRRIFQKLSELSEGNGLAFCMVNLLQAICEYNLGNADTAKKICEEIIDWSRAHMELQENLNFSATLYRAYNLLNDIARNAEDSSKEMQYAQQAIQWMHSDSGIPKEFLEIMKLRWDDAGKSEEDKLEDYRRAYELCRGLDLKNPLHLVQTASVAAELIHTNLLFKRWNDALAVARESEEYANQLLTFGTSNPVSLKIPAMLLAEIALAESHAKNPEKAKRLAHDSLKLLHQVYLQNPSPENWKLLQIFTGRLMSAGI